MSDNKGALIVVGNLSDGYRFVGPFDTMDDAADYADIKYGVEFTWIATLEIPEYVEPHKSPYVSGNHCLALYTTEEEYRSSKRYTCESRYTTVMYAEEAAKKFLKSHPDGVAVIEVHIRDGVCHGGYRDTLVYRKGDLESDG